MEYKKGIATRDDVLERALEIYKEMEPNIDATKEELDEVLRVNTKYIKKNLLEYPHASINLGSLGRAYWQQPFCNKEKTKNLQNAEKFGREYYKDRAKVWKERYDNIEETYQNNQPKKNRRKNWRLYHVIQPLIKSISIRGITMEEVEEIQNSI